MSRGYSVCAEDGCPELAAAGKNRCPTHAPKPWANTPKRTTPTGTRRWRTIRAQVLERDGHRCTVTIDGVRCTEPATEVDHIVPASRGGSDDAANLASVCAPHHRAKTQAEAAAARWRR